MMEKRKLGVFRRQMKRCGVTANVPAKKNASIIVGGHSRLSGNTYDVKFQRHDFRKS